MSVDTIQSLALVFVAIGGLLNAWNIWTIKR